jgi:hypothetical protein
MIKWINGILLALGIAVLVFPGNLFSRHSRHLGQRGDDDTVVHYSVLLAGMFLWPVIWDLALGYEILSKNKALWFAFLWPMVLCLFQMYDYSWDTQEDVETVENQRQTTILGVKADSGTIISIAFAMGTIFLVMSRVGDEQALAQAAKLAMIALLICIALIVPTAQYMDNNQKYTVFVRKAQRVFVNYSTGFIMAALLIVFTSGKKSGSRDKSDPVVFASSKRKRLRKIK